jgi:hypothetical protein
MELTEKDKQRIIRWLQEKCGSMRCTCCGMPNWEILPAASLPIGVDLHSMRFFYSQGIPQVGVVCTNCGHTLYFNPGVMGFRPDEPKPAPVPAK